MLSGTVYAGDDVTLATQAGAFSSSNVGTGISVTAADILGGATAGNYALIQPTDLVADITTAISSGSLIAAQKISTQLASNVFSPSYSQPQSFAISPPITTGQVASSDANAEGEANSPSDTKANVEMMIGGTGPTLKIENGGIRLPANIASAQSEIIQEKSDK
jgi:hypothetical protein